MSINQLFEISRRSFRALDAAMNTVADNVANANTEGYSRRRVRLQADALTSPGVLMPTRHGSVSGLGVSVAAYERVRDGMLAASANDARTGLGAAQEEERLLAALESLFPTGDGGVGSALDDFWNAWSDLADRPADTGLRTALRTQAGALADTLGRTAAGLDAFGSQTRSDLSAQVEAVNGLLDEIATINGTAEAARIQGSPDLAAEDRRDQLVQELSTYLPVEARQDGAAGYTVAIDGMTLVHGSTRTPLGLDADADPPVLLFGDTPVGIDAPAGEDGRIGAALRTLGGAVPEARAALDALASTLVTEVNALHQTGFGLDGTGGRDFFDPAGTTAGSLALSADVAADPSAIAASGDPAAVGDNAVALAIGGLRTQPLMAGGTKTPDGFVTDLLAGIGGRLDAAAGQAAGQAAVVDHLDAMERGVSGVSIDEEMTHLIEYQQAFAASARVLNTAQSM
ncbi:MAG: flagellar hook-associated protein FlgK, partial [Rhodothermales bacterium]|nr:flagellar hook-associated protein FlgK [Rhodothermales bacterium]